MFSLQPLLRQKISTANVKNIICLVERYYAHNLATYHNHKKNVHTIYRFRKYSTDRNKKDVTVSEGSGGTVTTSTYETIKENTKTVWYGGIVLAGLGITAVFFYALYRELFSSQSPNSIYSRAFDRCLKEQKVVDNLGEPIKCYGEESRGRRRHVSHLKYEKDGVNHMRMKFYIKGSRRTGTVHLEVKENDEGKYDFRYLFVQIDGYPYTTIVLEDNRNKAALSPLVPLNESNIEPVF